MLSLHHIQYLFIINNHQRMSFFIPYIFSSIKISLSKLSYVIKTSNQFNKDLYLLLLLITFILLPFNYFYASYISQMQDENDFDLDPKEKQSKVKKAAQSTFIFMLFIVFLLFLGLIFRPNLEISYERGKEVEWIKSLFDVEHVGEQALGFCISIIICFGSVLWIIYGSYGLTALPLYLIKGYKSLKEEKLELDGDLLKLKERYRSIQEKYSRSHLKISKNDQKALSNIKKKERLLNYKNDKLNELENQSRSLQAFLKIIYPFRIFIGLFTLAISLLIFASFAITIFEKINYSSCGMKCGYLIEKRTMLNPIDNLFVQSSYYFPLDYLIFFIFTVFIFICTLYGVITLGINFLCVKSLQIKREGTHPQVLFILAFIQNMSILVVCSQLMTLCPQYSTFGNQQFYDIKTRDTSLCTLEAVSKVEAKFICSMTNLSSFYNKISMSFPLFGVVFFLSNCAFIILYVIQLLVYLCKPKSSQFQELAEEIENDEENVTLLGGFN